MYYSYTVSSIIILICYKLIAVQDVVFTYQEKLPTIACEYEAPDVCAAGATVLIGNMMTLFVFLALTVLLL